MSAVPFYYAVRKGEQRVVPAHADILSGVDFRSALAEDNVARQDIFAAVFFDAAALGVGVAPVSRSSLSLFMCHLYGSFLLRLDGFNFYYGKLLAMAALALVALPAVLFYDYHFLSALVFEDLGRNARSLDEGRAELGVFAFADHQNVLDLDCVAGVRARKTVHEKNVALFYCELFSLYFNCSFHCVKIVKKRTNKRLFCPHASLIFRPSQKSCDSGIYPPKNFLCKLFVAFPQKFLTNIARGEEQRRMYSTLEKVILLALSDGNFAAADASDGSLARAYGAAAAADLSVAGLLPAGPEKFRLRKSNGFRGRVFEKSAAAAAGCAVLPDAARELEKIAPELERICVDELLEKSALATARQFGFFGREVLKVADARACRQIRESVFAAVSGGEEPDFRSAALIWALFCGGLAAVALSRAQLRKFGMRV